MKKNCNQNSWNRHSFLDLASNTISSKSEVSKPALTQTTKKSNFFYLSQELDKTVFNPENKPILIWNSLNTLSILAEAFIIPVILSLPPDNYKILSKIELIISVSFILDVFIKLNTGIYQQGHLNTSRPSILKTYLSKTLLLDLYSSLPFAFIFENSQFFNFFLLGKLLKVKNIYTFFDTLQLFLKDLRLMKALYYLKIFLSVSLCIHWLACLWFFSGEYDLTNQFNSWMLNESSDSIDSLFIKCVYYVISTTSTLGYGDYTPNGKLELLVSLLTIMIGVIIFSFNITNIISLVIETRNRVVKYQEKMITLNVYMKEKKLPQHIKYKLRKYLEYTNSRKTQSKMKESEILGLLSDPLREEVFGYTAGGKMIGKCGIFLQLFEGKIIRKISKYFKNKIFSPNDLVIEEGEISSQIYFITYGNVEVCHNQTKTVYKKLNTGSFFGEIGFFMKKPRTATIRSLEIVECLFFKREELDLVLQKFPMTAAKLQEVEIAGIHNNFSVLGIKCYLCKEIGHIACFCEYSRLSPVRFDIPQNWVLHKNESKVVKAKSYYKTWDRRNGVARPEVNIHKSQYVKREKLDAFNCKVRDTIKGWDEVYPYTENNLYNEGIQRIITSEESQKPFTEPRTVKYRFSILSNFPESRECEVIDLE